MKTASILFITIVIATQLTLAVTTERKSILSYIGSVAYSFALMVAWGYTVGAF